MAPDVTPIERLEDQAIAVDPPAIEAEFARIWQETARAGFDESSVRLRVVNLVALARSYDEWQRFEDVMRMMSQRHPCRGILALADPARSTLEATIAAHCWRSVSGQRHVCSEEVLLLGGARHERHLASAVLALLVPDIPLAVWFTGEAYAHGPLASALLESADQVILDSARSTGILRLFDSVLRLSETHEAIPSDLAWLRLSVWRELIAQMFDDPTHATELRRLTTITIDGAPAASEPLLLAGWLVSRLGYQPASVTSGRGELRATLYSGSRAVSLLVRQKSGAPLETVELRSADATFSVIWHAESGHLHIDARARADDVRRRVVEPPPTDDASMIGLALDGEGDVAVYAESVRAIQSLVS